MFSVTAMCPSLYKINFSDAAAMLCVRQAVLFSPRQRQGNHGFTHLSAFTQLLLSAEVGLGLGSGL